MIRLLSSSSSSPSTVLNGGAGILRVLNGYHTLQSPLSIRTLVASSFRCDSLIAKPLHPGFERSFSTSKPSLLPSLIAAPDNDGDRKDPRGALLSIHQSIVLHPQFSYAKRSFSRRTSAGSRVRTTVQERERPTATEASYEQQPRSDVPGSYSSSAPQSAQEEHVESQYQSLTPGTVQHLRKVYGTLAATTGIAASGALLGMAIPVAPIIPALGAMVPLLGIYFTDYRTTSPTLRLGFLASFGLLAGMSLGPLLGAVAAINPLTIPAALGLTAGIFGAMTGLSFVAKKRSFLSLGAPLLGGTLVLLGAGLAGMFVPVTSAWYPVLHNVSLYGGLALFSVFIAYDTQSIIADYEAGEKDVVRHAVNMFVNLKGIFVRLLSIFNSQND